jgi:transcriptional regulator with XRE-family HTH domain
VSLSLSSIVKNDIKSSVTGHLAQLVRRRREKLGWTQSDLARALGSSPSRVCKLEVADRSVAVSLMLKALAVMDCPLRIQVDTARDPFARRGLSSAHRRQLSRRLQRRRHAERLAERYDVDAGDVEHALYNLSLPPWERLARSFKRAGLKRLSAQ